MWCLGQEPPTELMDYCCQLVLNKEQHVRHCKKLSEKNVRHKIKREK